MIGCSDKTTPAEPQHERAVAVRVTEVSPAAFTKSIDYVGTVRAVDQVRITAQVGGTLDELAVDTGDRVEAGDVIARVATPELSARLDGVEAELRRARHEREYACDRFETDQELARDGVLTDAQLDMSRKMCRSSREGVSAAKAKRRELSQRVSDGVVVAPSDGQVLERLASAGEQVGPGRPMVIVGSRDLEVSIPVVESDLMRGIEVGTAVQMTVPGAEPVEAKVTEIAPRGSGPGRTFVATSPLPQMTAARPGMSVDVSFIIGRGESATLVPRASISAHGDESFVFLVDEDQRARKERVETGHRVEGRIEVIPSLPAGSRVVTTNVDELDDGDAVYSVEVSGGQR
ncbi:MAG: efflux RND transporter periplasmic adaptor subunit [Myxococcota bacterium]